MILDIQSKTDYVGGEFDVFDLLIEYEESGKTELKNVNDCLGLFKEGGYIYMTEVAFIKKFHTLIFSKDVSKEQAKEFIKQLGKCYYKLGTDCKAALAKMKLLGVDNKCDIDIIKLHTLAGNCGLKAFTAYEDYSKDKIAYRESKDHNDYNTIFVCKDYNIDYRIAQIDSLLYAVKAAKEDKCKKFHNLDRYQILVRGSNSLKNLFRSSDHNHNMKCQSLFDYLRDYMLDNLDIGLNNNPYYKIKVYFYVDQIIFCKIIDKEYKEFATVCVKSFYKQDSYGTLEYKDLDDFIRNDYEIGFYYYKNGNIKFF